MNDIFKKITTMYEDGQMTKSEYVAKIQELRTAKYQRDIKHNITKKERTFIDVSIIEEPKNDDGLFTLLYNVLLDNKMINDDFYYLVRNNIDKNIISNVEYFLKNDYLIGLFNLLTDKNYRYNTIGLKYVIAEFLSGLDSLDDLNIFKVRNNELNDKYAFLAKKGKKVKNYTRLYLIDDDVLMSTMLNDITVNVVLTTKDDIKHLYVGEKADFNTFNHVNIKSKRSYDHDEYIIYLVNRLLDNVRTLKGRKNVNMSDITNINDLHKYVTFFKDNEERICRYEKLENRYIKILNAYYKSEEFKSNNVELKNDVYADDYIISGNNHYTAKIGRTKYVPNKASFNYKDFL